MFIKFGRGNLSANVWPPLAESSEPELIFAWKVQASRVIKCFDTLNHLTCFFWIIGCEILAWKSEKLGNGSATQLDRLGMFFYFIKTKSFQFISLHVGFDLLRLHYFQQYHRCLRSFNGLGWTLRRHEQDTFVSAFPCMWKTLSINFCDKFHF